MTAKVRPVVGDHGPYLLVEVVSRNKENKVYRAGMDYSIAGFVIRVVRVYKVEKR